MDAEAAKRTAAGVELPASSPPTDPCPASEPAPDPIGIPTPDDGALPLVAPVAETAGPTEAAPSAAPDGPPAPSLDAPRPPPLGIPPVVDVQDLDWAAIRALVDPAAIRARMRHTVEGMEALLDRAGGPGMLFDRDRADEGDRAIKVAQHEAAGPLWFVGDLHGDLLALEAALALIGAEAEVGRSRIVFLGDLFDDGGFGLEVLLRVFELILDAPERVCLVTGNHDEALTYDGIRFGAAVSPSDFADSLNTQLTHEWVERAGKLAVRLFATAPRALFLPDGLLVAHGGFPLADLHARLLETGDWNDPACLSDFVWTRAHPTARKKLPNRFSRGSQFGREDFAAFCALSTRLGRPVDRMVRGHDHVEERYAIYATDPAHPILTTVALSRRLARESFGPYERVPTLARAVLDALPQVHRLHVPSALVREIYPEPADADVGVAEEAVS